MSEHSFHKTYITHFHSIKHTQMQVQNACAFSFVVSEPAQKDNTFVGIIHVLVWPLLGEYIDVLLDIASMDPAKHPLVCCQIVMLQLSSVY